MLPCCLVPWSSALGLTSCLMFRTLFAPRLNYCSRYQITPPCQALWILFADRRPCLLTWVILCLVLNMPVWTRTVMTMPLSNKALQMDPLVLSAPLQNTRPHEDPSAFLKNLDQVWTHSTSCSICDKGVHLLRNTSLNPVSCLIGYLLMTLY